MITIGTTIVYVLSAQDAEAINRRRTTGVAIAERMTLGQWPAGAQAHVGNPVQEGMAFPGVVVRDWSEESGAAGVDAKPNLQVWLDGSDGYWVTSVEEDGSKKPKPGTFSRR
jgi:hypothetical protein